MQKAYHHHVEIKVGDMLLSSGYVMTVLNVLKTGVLCEWTRQDGSKDRGLIAWQALWKYRKIRHLNS